MINPSLADLVADHIKNEKIEGISVTYHDSGVFYLTMDGDHHIAQIDDDQVRFRAIHLGAANPKFLYKLENVIRCFDSIIEKP